MYGRGIILWKMWKRGRSAAVLAGCGNLADCAEPHTALAQQLFRGLALQQLRLPYVDALRVQGQSPVAICARHLLPNLGAVIVAQATLTFGYALVDLAALSYLGLGADQSTADWGVMVGTGQADILSGHPQQSLYAGALIVVVVAACCILGERATGPGQGGRLR